MAKEKPQPKKHVTARVVHIDPKLRARAGFIYPLGERRDQPPMFLLMSESSDTSTKGDHPLPFPPPPPPPEVCLPGVIDVDLSYVEYEGPDLGVAAWDVNIDFDILGDAFPPAVLALPGLVPSPMGGAITYLNNDVFAGPTFPCGACCPPLTMHILVSVGGADGGGLVLTGSTDAFLAHSCPSVEIISVSVDVVHPKLPDGRNKAKLWFRWLVRSWC